MKLKLLLVLNMFVSGTFLFAQKPENAEQSSSAKNVFVEFGGNGVGFSANYDARFAKKHNGLGYRVGIGFFPGFDLGIFKVSTLFTLPVGINVLAGKGPHYFEAGIGATYISGTVSDFFGGIFGDEEGKISAVGFMPSIGYRFAPLSKGFSGRAIISPIIGNGGGSFFAGFSLGVKLK